MKWVWVKPSKPLLCWLTSPVKKVHEVFLRQLHSKLLLHFFCGYLYFCFSKVNWGPHLIIVPTSVMLNWEMELKRWCPGFKILTYFGSQKERKLKRQVMPLNVNVKQLWLWSLQLNVKYRQKQKIEIMPEQFLSK